MKITPDSSLFTALSSFPDAAQARQAAERRAALRGVNAGEANVGEMNVNDRGRRGGDAREALGQEILRRRQAEAVQGPNRADFAARVASTAKAERASGALDAGEAAGNAFRREAPNVDSKPRFIRPGQLVDIKV